MIKTRNTATGPLRRALIPTRGLSRRTIMRRIESRFRLWAQARVISRELIYESLLAATGERERVCFNCFDLPDVFPKSVAWFSGRFTCKLSIRSQRHRFRATRRMWWIFALGILRVTFSLVRDDRRRVCSDNKQRDRSALLLIVNEPADAKLGETQIRISASDISPSSSCTGCKFSLCTDRLLNIIACRKIYKNKNPSPRISNRFFCDKYSSCLLN